MKKLAISIISLLFILSGCTNRNESKFTGSISEVYEDSLLIQVDEDQEAYKSSDLISIPLVGRINIKENATEYHIGDRVCVYYEGEIMESYPAQIAKVSEIRLIE